MNFPSKFGSIIALLFAYFFLASPSLALDSSSPVSVSAFIGQGMVTIFGYTSPLSKVELTSFNVLAYTQSQLDGYFEFNQAILPNHPSDLCLRSIDSNNLSTKPICLPPPPDINFHTDMGPVILPPTLALDSSSPQAYQSISLSGQSIPDSVVQLNFYQKDDSPALLPKSALALAIPKLTLSTDSKGNWSTNLPTAYSTSYRFYASVLYQDSPSPLSNSLLYQLPSLWYFFWLRNSFYIFSYLLLFVTVALLLFLIFKLRKPRHYLPTLWQNYHSCSIPTDQLTN